MEYKGKGADISPLHPTIFIMSQSLESVEITYRQVIERLDTPEFADYARAFLAQEEPRFKRNFGALPGLVNEVEHLLEENDTDSDRNNIKVASFDSVADFINKKQGEYDQVKKLLDSFEKDQK